MSTNVNGVPFGGSVWSYGSVDAFKTAYDEVKNQRGNGAVAPVRKKPKKAAKEPVDTGLTRYLSSTGNVAQKLAHLYDINKFVDDFRLTGESEDELPETQALNDLKTREELKKYLSPDELAKETLKNDGGVEGAEKTLARMLEKKVLAAKQKGSGGSVAQLTTEERTKIGAVCHTALAKTFQAYTLERVSEFLSQKGRLSPGSEKNVQLTRATDELDAILNTALGAAELLMNGRISENSVVTLLRDGSMIDLANTLDVTLMLKRAAASAKEQFTQKTELEEFARNPYLSDAERTAIRNVIAARERFTRVLDFEIREHDPSGKLGDETFQARQLQDVKLRLQQFRYDLERCTGKVGKEFGHRKYSYYGIMEQLRRACSNLKGDRHLSARFTTDAERNRAYDDLRDAERNLPSTLPKRFRTSLVKRAEKACDAAHEANVGARMSQDTAAARRTEDVYAHKVLDLLHKTGGMQMTKTEISVSAALDIGPDAIVSGQVSAGGFCRTNAAVVAIKGGGYLLVLSKEGGGRFSAKAEAGADSAEAKVVVEGGTGRETKLFFTNQDELIAYCRQNCPNLLSAIPGSFTDLKDRALMKRELGSQTKGSLGTFVSGFAKVGKFLGNATGLRIHRTKHFTETNFENKMRRDGVFGNLDGILHRRLNGLAVSSTVSTTSFGSFEASADVDAGTDAMGVRLNAGATVAGVTTTSRMKGLKSIQSFVSMHTADEMKRTVLPDLFNDFYAYRKTAPKEYRDGPDVENLKKFVFDEPPWALSEEERAEFWSGQISTLAAHYRKLEGDCSVPRRGKKANRALQVDFARQTRVYAAVNEYLAKRIESELSVAESPRAKAALASALKVARESLGATLARSNIVLEADIVREHLRFGREIFAGKSRGFSVKAEVGWDVGLKTTDSSSKASGSEETNPAVSVFKGAFMDAMGGLKADGEKILKGLTGLSGKVSGKMSYTNYVKKGDSVKPWANANALKFEFDVSYPLGPLSLIEMFKKLKRKAKAEYPDEKDVMRMMEKAETEFAVELGKQLGATVLIELDKAAATLVSPITSLGQVLLVSGVKKALEKIGVSLGLSTTAENAKGAKLELVFENDRFTQCKVSDYVQNRQKLEIKANAAKLPVSVSFKKTDTKRREQVVFDLMPDAVLGTLLSRGAGQLTDLGKCKDYLCKNQKAANDVVRDLRKTKVRGEVIYANRQLQAIRDGLENLMKLHQTADEKIPARMKEAAKSAYFNALMAWSDLVAKAPPPGKKGSEATNNELLAKLAGSLVTGYGLLDSAQQLGWSVPSGGKQARI